MLSILVHGVAHMILEGIVLSRMLSILVHGLVHMILEGIVLLRMLSILVHGLVHMILEGIVLSIKHECCLMSGLGCMSKWYVHGGG